MYNFHPPLSAFPLVLFSIAVVAELILVFKKHDLLYLIGPLAVYAGTFLTILTFLTGYLAGSTASITFDVDPNAIAQHHNVGRIILFLQIPLLVLTYLKTEHSFVRIIFYLNLVIVYLLILYTGYLGAELIFTHGAGVKAQL